MSAGWECWTRPSAKCWATRTWRSVVPRAPSAVMRCAVRPSSTRLRPSNQEQADAELKAKRDKAIEDQNDARAVKEREVEEARTAAEERKRAAAEAAQKRTAAAKQQADEVAAQLKNLAEAAKREEQATIRAAEQKATAAAESKLDDAQAKRSDAASKRAQADQVEELANLEKQKRQSERANNG